MILVTIPSALCLGIVARLCLLRLHTCLRLATARNRSSLFLGIIVLGSDRLSAQGDEHAAEELTTQHSAVDVTEIDIDDLMTVRVTSPAKKEQPLTDVPSAIYVIREEDLRRSGATSLAEALRAVPGLQVARSNSNTWAITARGFSDTLSNKLLVLIDGRTVYSPLHSGVFWDVQDTLLEDVERIEVLRGPGGALWGANAINGVINVITKRAEDTQGGLVTGGGGTEERGFGAVRYGFKAADNLYVRVYGKYFDRDDTVVGVDPDKTAYDGWSMIRGGFRSDWLPRTEDRIIFTADYYDGDVKERITLPSLTAASGTRTVNSHMDVRGGNFISRWGHDFSPSSGMLLQLYYDYTFRSGAAFTDALHTGDLDFQHRFRLLDLQDFVWGFGYRLYRSEFDGDFAFQVTPQRHTDDIVSAFVQDELTLIPDHLRLTIGSKFEYNDYSGFEAQPSARLTCNLGDRHMLWGSISRAVRTPSIIDVDGRLTPTIIPGPTPIVVSIFGRDQFQTEELIAYEGGYRMRPLDFISLDLAGFYNQYDRLRSGRIGPPFGETSPSPAHVVVPVNLHNDLQGETWGFELAANIQLTPWWLVQANYAYLHMHLSEDSAEGRDPEDTVWIRSAMDLPWNFSLDVTGRYLSALDAFDLDSYVEVDVRIAWRDPSRKFEAAIVGQNLLHESHPEFLPKAQRTEIQRGLYVSVSWRF